MGRFITVIILLLSLHTHGQQMSNRGYNGNYRPVTHQYVPYNAEKEAGILRYDLEEVLKKLKIKETNEKAPKIATLLKNYDAKIENIQLMYRATFAEMDLLVEKKKEELRSNNTPELYKELEDYISKNIDPVRTQVMPHVDALNEQMLALLSQKEHQKWVKYKQKQSQKVD